MTNLLLIDKKNLKKQKMIDSNIKDKKLEHKPFDSKKIIESINKILKEI